MHSSVSPDTANEPEFYTVAKAAAILKVSEKTLRKALKAGRIPSIEVGPGSIRIPMDGLRELWEQEAAS